MKNKTRILCAALCAFALSLLTACNTTLDPNGEFGKLPNGMTIYQAESAVVTSYNTMDAFLLWEDQNHAFLAANYPQVVSAANTIRANAPSWVKTATVLIDAYKSNPSKDGATELTQALAVMSAGASQASQYLAETKIH